MALTSVDFSTTFDYTVSPKLFKFEDTTDYSGQGIALTSVVGCLSITAPSGVVVYNNTNFNSPDINPDVSLENSTTIQLPLLGNGTVQQGTYSITYTVQVAATTLTSAYTVSETKTINFTYSTPTGDLDIEVDLTAPLMTSTDNTNYTISINGSPFNPTITRDHRLYYPATLGVSPITGTGSVVSTATFYAQANVTLVYTSSLTSELSYDLGNGFYILDEMDAYGQFDLNTDTTLCDLYCGIKTLYNNWQYCKGTPRGNDYLNKLIQVTAIGDLLQSAIDCGKTADVATYAAMIREIGQFTEDCACSNGTPVLVTGTGGSGTVIVEAGTGMSVATSVSGTTTTYTVSLSNANVTKLSGLRNTDVSAGTGISVSSVTDSDGNITYTITNTQLQPNMLNLEVLVAMSPGSTPTVTNSFYYNYGTKFQNATVANDNTILANWQNLNNAFTISNFFSGSSSNYTVLVNDIEYTPYYATPTIAPNPVNLAHPYDVKVVDKNSTDFKVQILDETGIPLAGSAVDASIETIKFNITITA